ncbi:MAG: TraR/DksA family transcriptional regulator [Bdellovibrionota bacterium]
MAQVTKALLEKCKRSLLEAKTEILNRVRDVRKDLGSSEDGKSGDEGDQTTKALAESEVLTLNERLRSQLVEIEMALVRIDQGTYGICEETEEPIEADRLLAIPWTRLSIEGAEMRESMNRRYAR